MSKNIEDTLKLALEALERGETELRWKAITAIKEALAQPEQRSNEHLEPVVGTKTWFEDGKVVTQYLHPSDIYTTPPQRKPLTNKEIDSFREANSEGRGAGWRFNFKGFARAIEAAHGIKGDA